MKTLAIENERRPLKQLLAEGNGKEVIYLTKKGRAKYALVPLDEGDEEVLAIRRNAKLMSYLDRCEERALRGPRKTLEEIEERFGLSRKRKRRR